MAGGPLHPHSPYIADTSGQLGPNTHIGAGSAGKYDEGWGLVDATALTGNRDLYLKWDLPEVLPTGACKLSLLSIANATTGDVVVNIQWVSVGKAEDPSATAFFDEGNTTISFTAADDYKETKITLDADTVVAGEVLSMLLRFVDTGTTLAVMSTHRPRIIWE